MRNKQPKIKPKSKRVAVSVSFTIGGTGEDGKTAVLSSRQARSMLARPSMTALRVSSLPRPDGQVVSAIAVMHTDNRMAVRDQRLLMAWAIKSARQSIREKVAALQR